jgi:hypothetical protein
MSKKPLSWTLMPLVAVVLVTVRPGTALDSHTEPVSAVMSMGAPSKASSRGSTSLFHLMVFWAPR